MDAGKEKALRQITALCAQHHISASDIAKVLSAPQTSIAAPPKALPAMVRQLFSYLAALAFLASIAIFFSHKAEDWGPYFRTVFLSGSALSFFAAALLTARHEKLELLFNPLLLVAGILLPSSLVIFLGDFFHGGNPELASCIIFTVVGAQFALAYFYTGQRNGPLFGALLFFYALVLSIYNMAVPRLLDGDNSFFFIVFGLSGFAAASALNRTRHAVLAPFFQVVGMAIALIALYSFAENNHLAFITPFAGVAAVLAALKIQSRGTLIVSVLGLVFFLGMITKEYFPDALAWPLILFLLGVGLAFGVFYDFSKFRAGKNIVIFGRKSAKP